MFTDSEPSSPIPDLFFRRLLKEVVSLEELKVTAYALWRFEHMDGSFRALSAADFDPQDLGLTPDQFRSGLDAALARCTFLRSEYDGQVLFFLNSPQGQAASRQFAASGLPGSASLGSAPLERPNVFQLYEENIGPLTPLIADALIDAERTYSPEWVADAIELAVKHNKRSWKYAEAILKRWKEEGRAEKQSGRDDQESRQHNVEDKIKKFTGGAG